MSDWPAATRARIGTTVAELGSPEAGAVGQIRVGSSPYELIGLIYNPTLGKWVSSALGTAFDNTGETFTSTAYALSRNRLIIPHFKALYDAGLRPQAYYLADSVANSSNALNSLKISMFGVSDNVAAATASIETADPVYSRTNSAAVAIITQWVDLGVVGAAPADDAGWMVPAWKRAAGTLTVTYAYLTYRWVSA